MNKCGDAFVNDLCHRTSFKQIRELPAEKKGFPTHNNSLRRKSNAGKIIAGNARDI